MRILHINTYDSGGAFIAAYRLHKELRNKGIDSRFLVLKKYGSYPDVEEFISSKRNILVKLKESLRYRSLQIFINFLRNKINKHGEQVSLPYTPYDIAKHELVESSEIINLHFIRGFLDYPSFCKKVQKPIFWTLHDMNPFNGYLHYYYFKHTLPLETTIKNLKNRITARSNIFFISPSTWMFQLSTAQLKVENTLIHNGIDTIKFKNKIERPDSPTIVVGSSSFDFDDTRKGFKYLVKVLQKTESTFSTLVIGAMVQSVSREIRETINISYTGFLKDEESLIAAYSRMHLFVITSLIDNLPNVVIEAMACGKPVVAFNVGGMADMIHDGMTGFLVNPYDVDEMANKVQLLITNKTLRIEMGLSARKLVERKFNVKHQAEKYLNLYKKVRTRGTG